MKQFSLGRYISFLLFFSLLLTPVRTWGVGWTPSDAGHGGIRRDTWDDPDEDDPVGVVPETPIGEPLILLLFALLFIVYKRRIAS